MLKRRLIPKLQLGLRRSFRGPQPVLVVTRQFGSLAPSEIQYLRPRSMKPAC